jgi:ComF family protein
MRVVESIGAIVGRVMDLALPARCAGCGEEGPAICQRCEPALDARLERRAGVPIGLPATIPYPLLQLEWSAPYAGTVRKALHELKYAGEQRLAGPLGAAIARRWRRAGLGGEIVVHVPVSAERLKQRGYDQAALIARAAAHELGIPAVDALERHRATVPQFELDRSKRAGNVHGAFRVRQGQDQAIRGRWELIVDDVTTTGATLAACADALMAAGAYATSAITVARER